MGGPGSANPFGIPEMGKGGAKKKGEKGALVPVGKILPPALVEGPSKILLAYPDQAFTTEYSGQIRRALHRKGIDIYPADNFNDALDLVRSAPFLFGILISAADIARSPVDSAFSRCEPGLGRELAHAAFLENSGLLAIVETNSYYEVHAPGKVHPVPKDLEANAILTFQKLVVTLMPP